jgi:hypothetical protein
MYWQGGKTEVIFEKKLTIVTTAMKFTYLFFGISKSSPFVMKLLENKACNMLN